MKFATYRDMENKLCRETRWKGYRAQNQDEMDAQAMLEALNWTKQLGYNNMQIKGKTARLTKAVKGDYNTISWTTLTRIEEIKNCIEDLQDSNKNVVVINCYKEANKAATALANTANATVTLNYSGYPPSFLFETLSSDRFLALKTISRTNDMYPNSI
ncbi:hypothetical protein C5167_017256 [Papaver somniferum]|uniref:RNase H type-1 domain-containing protein n=1 Tax=Papaver somniferum TaxID=3469 RepID=A0A4Y7IM77_PAPSO|nr:hypothetical protein C5167_017256 [Papaver somniferum]